MSTGPEVCDVPTGGLARERWGLHAPGGAALTPKWIPEARGQSGPENMLAAPADSERQPRGPHLGSRALPKRTHP